jgi:hypothetical protein
MSESKAPNFDQWIRNHYGTTGTPYGACAACGKVGKKQGEAIDNKDLSITHPICGHCCAMWDDVDTKDDVWAAICVRRNSGEYMPVCQPKKEDSPESGAEKCENCGLHSHACLCYDEVINGERFQ